MPAIKQAGFTSPSSTTGPTAKPRTSRPAPRSRPRRKRPGLTYTAIPMGREGVTPDMVEKTRAALEGSEGPVLCYCRSGTRSTTLWALSPGGTDAGRRDHLGGGERRLRHVASVGASQLQIGCQRARAEGRRASFAADVMSVPSPPAVRVSSMPIKKILVANRSEIAIRVFRAANELGIKTVAVFAEEDKLALHRFKADEAYLIGKGKGPVEAYLQIDEYIRIARISGRRCHPSRLRAACPRARNSSMPARMPGSSSSVRRAQTMRDLGNKVAARNMAIAADVPVVPATDAAARRSRRSRQDGRRDRLSADAQGELGRRRTRHAPDHGREDAALAKCPRASARPRRRSARTRCISKS